MKTLLSNMLAEKSKDELAVLCQLQILIHLIYRFGIDSRFTITIYQTLFGREDSEEDVQDRISHLDQLAQKVQQLLEDFGYSIIVNTSGTNGDADLAQLPLRPRDQSVTEKQNRCDINFVLDKTSSHNEFTSPEEREDSNLLPSGQRLSTPASSQLFNTTTPSSQSSGQSMRPDISASPYNLEKRPFGPTATGKTSATVMDARNWWASSNSAQFDFKPGMTGKRMVDSAGLDVQDHLRRVRQRLQEQERQHEDGSEINYVDSVEARSAVAAVDSDGDMQQDVAEYDAPGTVADLVADHTLTSSAVQDEVLRQRRRDRVAARYLRFQQRVTRASGGDTNRRRRKQQERFSGDRGASEPPLRLEVASSSPSPSPSPTPSSSSRSSYIHSLTDRALAPFRQERQVRNALKKDRGTRLAAPPVDYMRRDALGP